MNPESSSEDAPPAETPSSTDLTASESSETASTPAASRRRSKGLPTWLPAFLLAVVPAVIVGVLVYALVGGDSGGGKAGVLDSLIRGSAPGVESYDGELPPGFPENLPAYGGAKVIYSLKQSSPNGTVYLVIYETGDESDDVYNFYIEEMNEDPYQVEVGQSSEQVTGVTFSRSDNADVNGQVEIHRSQLGNSTTIQLQYQDVSETVSAAAAPGSGVPSQSKALPDNYPKDEVPIFEDRSGKSLVTSSAFQRAAGGQAFLVTFLTKGSQDDVIDYYRDQFRGRNWTVTDSEQEAGQFSLGIEFSDGPSQLLTGSVSADTFSEDSDYTEVQLLVQVSGSRGRGN